MCLDQSDEMKTVHEWIGHTAEIFGAEGGTNPIAIYGVLDPENHNKGTLAYEAFEKYNRKGQCVDEDLSLLMTLLNERASNETLSQVQWERIFLILAPLLEKRAISLFLVDLGMLPVIEEDACFYKEMLIFATWLHSYLG